MDNETIFWILIVTIATVGLIVDEYRLERRDED